MIFLFYLNSIIILGFLYFIIFIFIHKIKKIKIINNMGIGDWELGNGD